MITIQVNDKTQTFLENLTVYQLIGQLNIQTNGIAVAVNNDVISKPNWETRELVDQDNILIIKSTQGG
ncbi:thiamine biosynthesis protein ThiS [Tenacibaculum sp. SZ-18]|uniref:sulfur carrier protein ThiS n=1 Tax=Tenacibaculum sp. SZ-18 TaxID=754423 RepID=UPI000C2D078D|nr:sulfur carrier protein ThiS [Tenacibaculum sp. SZ-18]AUC15682.1 thiamine biosynthesis protein ThiS [Tenacibaculum sp. SZ-18]